VETHPGHRRIVKIPTTQACYEKRKTEKRFSMQEKKSLLAGPEGLNGRHVEGVGAAFGSAFYLVTIAGGRMELTPGKRPEES